MMRFIGLDAIEVLNKMGAKVYMRPGRDCATWATYSIGDNIAYLQAGEWGGYDVSTIHVPNKNCGTGFRITEHAVYPLTEGVLRSGFIVAPNWALTRDRKAVVKYKNPADYFAKSYGGSKYVELPDIAVLKHAADDLALFTIHTAALYEYVKDAMGDLRADRIYGRFALGFWAEHVERAKALYVKEMGADDHTACFDWVCVEQEVLAQIKDHYEDEIKGV